MKATKQRPPLWTLGFLNVCIANFLMACSFNLLMPSIPLYITEQLGVPQTQTGIVLASYALAVFFIRPFSGFLVDLYSRKSILLVSFVCYVAIFTGYFFATTVLFFVIIRFFTASPGAVPRSPRAPWRSTSSPPNGAPRGSAITAPS